MNVWVTRDETTDGPLSTALRQVGMHVLLEPVLARRPLSDAADSLHRLGPDDWLVLTSPYAVEAVAAEPARIPRVAVVGDASRRAALARGFRVDKVAVGATAANLLAELKHEVVGGKICYPRSSLAPEPSPWPGVEMNSPVLYETAPRPFDRQAIERADVVTVASPSAVNAIGKIDAPFASIGPATTAALRALNINPWIEAPTPDFPSLATAIAAQAGDARHHRA